MYQQDLDGYVPDISTILLIVDFIVQFTLQINLQEFYIVTHSNDLQVELHIHIWQTEIHCNNNK